MEEGIEILNIHSKTFIAGFKFDGEKCEVLKGKSKGEKRLKSRCESQEKRPFRFHLEDC